MTIQYEDLSGWTFDASEVSAGVYTAFGLDQNGRKIEMTGTDPEALIEECRKTAVQMMIAHDETVSKFPVKGCLIHIRAAE